MAQFCELVAVVARTEERALTLFLLAPKEFLDEVGAPHLTEQTGDVLPFGRLVPEKELTLGKLFFLCLGRKDGLEGVGMKSCVPCFG